MSAARLLEWPMRSISSRRLAPASATGLDPLPGLASGVGDLAGVVDEAAAAHPAGHGGERRGGEVVDPAELLRGHALGYRIQGVGLEADAFGDQGGDVTAAAVLAEQVGRVPEPGDGFAGDRERAQGRVHGAALGRGTCGRLSGLVGGPGDAGTVRVRIRGLSS
jgi:hypothetical protein